MTNQKTDHNKFEDNNFSMGGIFKGFSNSPDLPDAILMVIGHKHGVGEVIVYDAKIDDGSRDTLDLLEAGTSYIEVAGSITSDLNIVSLIANKIRINKDLDGSYSRFIYTGTVTAQEPIIHKNKQAMRVSAWRIKPDHKDKSDSEIIAYEGFISSLDFVDKKGCLPATVNGTLIRFEGDMRFDDGCVEFIIEDCGAPEIILGKKAAFAELINGTKAYNHWKLETEDELGSDAAEDMLYRLGFIYIENIKGIGLASDGITLKEVLGGKAIGGGRVVLQNKADETLSVSLNQDFTVVSSLTYDSKKGRHAWRYAGKSKPIFREAVAKEGISGGALEPFFTK